MKRIGNLLPQIADSENLRWAFWKAKKGKKYTQEVLDYQLDLEVNLLQLQSEILSGNVEVGDYHYFKIYDPKEREICASAFREQVLHHALMSICHPYFERYQISDSYASRPKKGVHVALNRAKQFTKPKIWFLKLDVRKFFASIPHSVLKEQLERVFKDYYLLDILGKIIDSYEADIAKGLPIGNLSSQYFANHFLAVLDHFVKEQLQCKSYVRYMDDMVLWHADKDYLKKVKKEIENFVEGKLRCKLKPSLLNKTERGLPFCGYIIRPGYVRLSQRSKRRFIVKMENLQERYHSGEWSEEVCQRVGLPLVAFTRYGEAKGFRQQVLNRGYLS